MQHVLITGANRGIGLELVRQFAAQPDTRIFAGVRTPATATDLNALAAAQPERITVLPLEVTDAEAVQNAVHVIADRAGVLDLLINNAAINPPRERQTVETISRADMLDTLEVNVVAPLLIVQASLALLRASDNPRVINISSGAGSLAKRDSGAFYAYSTSKAALNMVTRMLAVDLADDGITAIALDPGWVKTDMGGTNARLEPEESVSAIVALAGRLSRADSGTFIDRLGEPVPW